MTKYLSAGEFESVVDVVGVGAGVVVVVFFVVVFVVGVFFFGDAAAEPEANPIAANANDNITSRDVVTTFPDLL